MAANNTNNLLAGNMAGNLGSNLTNHLQSNMARQAQLAAQHAQAFQNNINAGPRPQAGGQARGPFFGNQGAMGGPPMLGANIPPNFFAAMQAMTAAAAQDNNGAIVAAAKLGPVKGNTKANSNLVVRNSIRKFHVNGGLVSVAQWTRKCVEENLDWLVKLVRRHHEDKNLVLLVFGDGCETLVFMDDQANKIPSDFVSIPRIAVGVSLADSDFKGTEEKLALDGILQPTDSIWEHLKYDQSKTEEDEKHKCLYLHTRVNVWTDGMDARRRVIQVVTGGPNEPFLAKHYIPNYPFAKQVLDAWRISNAAKLAKASGGETLITFNPKELVLLEKAFDGKLTAKDRKMDCANYGDEDTKNAQKVIKRAQEELSDDSQKAAPSKEAETSDKKPPAKKKAPPKPKAVKQEEKESEEEDAKKKTTRKKATPKSKVIKKEEPAEESEESEEEDKKKKTPKKAAPKIKKEETKKEESEKESDEESDEEDTKKTPKKATPKSKVSKTPERQTRRSSASKAVSSPDPSKKRGRPKGSKNKEAPTKRGKK